MARKRKIRGGKPVTKKRTIKKASWSVNLKGGATHEVPKGKTVTLNGVKYTEDSYKKTSGHIIGSQAVKAKRSVDKQIHEKYTSRPSFAKELRAEHKQAKDKESRTAELNSIWNSQRTKGSGGTSRAIRAFKKKHGKKSKEYLEDYLEYRKDKQERRNLGLIPSKILS